MSKGHFSSGRRRRAHLDLVATNLPGDSREFVTTFGLTQPGAEIALKVFVVLTTGNEAGGAAMLVDRPASVQLLAA